MPSPKWAKYRIILWTQFTIMKLYEFFGNIKHDANEDSKPGSPNKEEQQEIADQTFWYILDDNDLHKEFFMPIAKELKKIYDSKSKEDDMHDWKVWMPMVKKGCMEFYKEHEVPGDPNDSFNKDFRIDLCKRLADHYHDEIIKGDSDK